MAKFVSKNLERVRNQINHWFQEQDHLALEKMFSEGRAIRFTITPQKRLEIVLNVEYAGHEIGNPMEGTKPVELKGNT